MKRLLLAVFALLLLQSCVNKAPHDPGVLTCWPVRASVETVSYKCSRARTNGQFNSGSWCSPCDAGDAIFVSNTINCIFTPDPGACEAQR